MRFDPEKFSIYIHAHKLIILQYKDFAPSHVSLAVQTNIANRKYSSIEEQDTPFYTILVAINIDVATHKR